MTFHFLLFLLSFCFLLCLAWLWHLDWAHHGLPRLAAKTAHPMVHRLLKPRTPLDCPACRLASTASSDGGPAPAPVRPWRVVKSRRGAPKRVNTEGYACPNQQCAYCGITDAHIHALVGDGKRGRAERIQTFRCQACLTTFTARRHTPLYHLKTPSYHVAMGSLPLPKGWILLPRNGSSATGRRPSPPGYLAQASTLRRCTSTLSATSSSRMRQVLWLWLAIDPCTKLLPVLYLGPRTQHAAHKVIHSLRLLLAPGCVPLFNSDGLNLYFYALTAHFGQWLQVVRRGRQVRRWQVEPRLIYGQVKKSYRRRKLVRVTHVMRLGTEDALTVTLQRLGLSGRLNTAFIERVNLTIRHGIAALARRTWATAQQSPPLLAHLEWWRAYYHFVRPHQSLRVKLVQPRERGGKVLAQRYRQRTEALAAGRTHRRWTACEVLSCPLPSIFA